MPHQDGGEGRENPSQTLSFCKQALPVCCGLVPPVQHFSIQEFVSLLTVAVNVLAPYISEFLGALDRRGFLEVAVQNSAPWTAGGVPTEPWARFSPG